MIGGDGSEVDDVGIFDKLRRKGKPGQVRGASKQDTAHLAEWAGERKGVEAFLEPRTTVTQTTVVLIAHDGEWTRRRVASEDAAFDFGRKLGIPVYEVQKVGYPQRMRDFTERQKRGEV
jgi:hypothetical protein